MSLTVREASPDDVEVLADLVFASFRQVADKHHAYTFTGSSRERSRAIVAEAVAAGHVVALIATNSEGVAEGFAALLALSTSTFMLDTVAVAVGSQCKGSGRQIVEAAIAQAISQATSQGHEGDDCEVRLLVDSYNMPALALYSRCGFAVTGTVAVLELPADTRKAGQEEESAFCVRSMSVADVEECTALARRLASLDAAGELAGHLAEAAVVLGSSGRVVGYCSRPMITGHLVCEDKAAAMALLGWMGRQAASPGEARQLVVPLQQYPDLAQWMLGSGWRAVKTLLQMSHGRCGQIDPTAVYFPMC